MYVHFLSVRMNFTIFLLQWNLSKAERRFSELQPRYGRPKWDFYLGKRPRLKTTNNF